MHRKRLMATMFFYQTVYYRERCLPKTVRYAFSITHHLAMYGRALLKICVHSEYTFTTRIIF